MNNGTNPMLLSLAVEHVLNIELVGILNMGEACESL